MNSYLKIKRNFWSLFFLAIIGSFLWMSWHFLFPPVQQGPTELVWDKDICSHCGMHIEDTDFAAQAQLEGGGTLFFDDVGCLVHYFDLHEDLNSSLKSMYFRNAQEKTWLSSLEVGFIYKDSFLSPMGYNFMSVRKENHPQAFHFDQMRQKILEGKVFKDKREKEEKK